MIVMIIDFIQKWSRFLGSFDTLLMELLFMLFSEKTDKDLLMLMLSVFISGPRSMRSNDKQMEKFKRLIKPFFFENVKTKKKSTLILI